MPAVHSINPNADVISARYALSANISAAKGLMNVLKTNLGPSGTLKMLVGGAGQIKLTKDGNILLKEMQIQHPTANLIARTAVAQDDVTGDGTCSVVLIAGELLVQAERYINDGVHPRVLVEGIEIARDEALKFLDSQKIEVECDEKQADRETLKSVASTALRTKLSPEMADHLTDIVVDAVLTIRKPGEDIDLHMVEIMIMEHQSEFDTKLIKGLVLDHGARHPNMKRHNEDCHILTCNIGMEWEKTEVNSAFFWSNAEEREKLVAAERKHVNNKVQAIIDLKKKVCKENQSFVVINQNGIDPIALDMLQKEGIVGIRRAKRRNMERIPLACGGYCVNTESDLTPDCLGWAGEVYEHTLDEDVFTFVEHVKNPRSCTILIRGPNKHTIDQVKDAVQDGLRAVKNVFTDQCVIAGAGCFEAKAHNHLLKYMEQYKGKAKLGIQAFADCLLAIPKTLAVNSGLDQTTVILNLKEKTKDASATNMGINLKDGDLMPIQSVGIYDNYCVKKQLIQLGAVIACKLLLVDEIMRAGRAVKKD